MGKDIQTIKEQRERERERDSGLVAVQMIVHLFFLTVLLPFNETLNTPTVSQSFVMVA